MNEYIYKDIYLNHVGKYGKNFLGVDYVELHRCKDGTIIAISSDYKLMVITTDPLLTIDPSTYTERIAYVEGDKGKGVLPFSSIFEHDYNELNVIFRKYGYMIDEVFDLREIIRAILRSSPYRTKLAVKWIRDSSELSFREFSREIEKIIRSDSYTRAFKRELKGYLENDSVDTIS